MKLKLLVNYLLITFLYTPFIRSEENKIISNEDSNVEKSVSHQNKVNGKNIHIVKVGDTLSSISKLYSIDLKTIVEINKLADANYIFVGQKLIIPEIIENQLNDINFSNQRSDKVKFHEVSAGETLTDIAYKYDIKIERLIIINKLEDANTLKAGTILFLENIDSRNNLKESEIRINQTNFTQNKTQEYGPITIKSEKLEIKNGRSTLDAINKNGNSLIISLDCEKKEIDVRLKGRKWKGWLPAKRDFEKNLLREYCGEIYN